MASSQGPLYSLLKNEKVKLFEFFGNREKKICFLRFILLCNNEPIGSYKGDDDDAQQINDWENPRDIKEYDAINDGSKDTHDGFAIFASQIMFEDWKKNEQLNRKIDER